MKTKGHPVTEHAGASTSSRPVTTTLNDLVGSGDKIGLLTLPFLVVGIALSIAYPSVFAVGGPPTATGVALLVLPWAGFLLNTWLGAALGTVVYVGSRMLSPTEDAQLATTFRGGVGRYLRKVKIPWL